MSHLELVIETTGDAVQFAFVDDSRLSFFWHFDPRQVTGQLFRAQVSEIDKTLDGAFLTSDVPGMAPLFMQGRDIVADPKKPQPGNKRSIAQRTQVGQSLIVEGIREAKGDKGPRVSGKVQIKGRYLVFAPFARQHAASPRLKGHMREKTLAELNKWKGTGGLIARRLAAHADPALLLEEAQELSEFWAKLIEARGKPQALKPFLPPTEALIWQALDWPLQQIATNDPGIAARLRQITSAIDDDVEFIALDALSAFEATGVKDELAIATSREVPLSEGGRILIDQTAACVAIDVDGGGLPAITANLAAADEIGRQCRLRNLGGTIIVDFIDMPTKPQLQKLEQALRRSFKNDPVSVQILPISNLGIAQISRAKRGGNPLMQLQTVCPSCGQTIEVS